MKKLLLLFFFSILFVNSQGQTSVYHQFPDSDAVWTVYTHRNSGLSCLKFDYVINGDTIFNTKVYHRLFQSGVYYAGCDTFPSNFWSNYYKGSFREDTSLRKVYYLPPDSINESLLYDFSLKVGDTIPSCWGLWSYQKWFFVGDIDSILINSSYRKRFIIWGGGCCPYPTIIEGIGCEFGLLQYFYGYDYDQLLCFSEKGTSVYPTYSTLACPFVSSVDANNNEVDFLRISPNPAFNKITISNYPFSNKEASIEIYNMVGEKLQTSNFKPESAVDVSNLAPGVYLVEVRDVADSPGRRTKMWRGKMIKE